MTTLGWVSQFKQHWENSKKGLRFLIIIFCVLGIFFRFVNLDQKFYWYDESMTSLRISGYTEAEFHEEFYDREPISIDQLHKYQRVDRDKSLIDLYKGLIKENPHLPPLSLTLIRWWGLIFGDSIIALRSFAAIASLFAFPAIFWLCWELFRSPVVGWTAMALIAVSPFHVLYAQEARWYSLWTVVILVSSALLLRAIRVQTKLMWGLYAATVAVGPLIFAYSVLVIIGHGIYVAITEGFRRTKTLKSYLLACLIGGLIGGIWPLLIAINWVNTRHLKNRLSAGWEINANPISLLKRWAGHFIRLFYDVGLDSRTNFTDALVHLPAILLVLGVSIYGIYYVYRRTPQRIWLFIWTLIGTTAVATMLPDLILGGRRLAGSTRYLIPCYLGIQLAVAYLITTKVTTASVSMGGKKIWKIIAVIFFSVGVFSCAVASQAETWWNKGLDQGEIAMEIARIVNQTDSPKIASNSRAFALILPLSYYLEPTASLKLIEEQNIDNIADDFKEDFFIYRPSSPFLKELEENQNYQIEPVYSLEKTSWTTQQKTLLLKVYRQE